MQACICVDNWLPHTRLPLFSSSHMCCLCSPALKLSLFMCFPVLFFCWSASVTTMERCVTAPVFNIAAYNGKSSQACSEYAGTSSANYAQYRSALENSNTSIQVWSHFVPLLPLLYNPPIRFSIFCFGCFLMLLFFLTINMTSTAHKRLRLIVFYKFFTSLIGGQEQRRSSGDLHRPTLHRPTARTGLLRAIPASAKILISHPNMAPHPCPNCTSVIGSCCLISPHTQRQDLTIFIDLFNLQNWVIVLCPTESIPPRTLCGMNRTFPTCLVAY